MMAERFTRAADSLRPDSSPSRATDAANSPASRQTGREMLDRTAGHKPFGEAIAQASRAAEQQAARRLEATAPAHENERIGVWKTRDDARAREDTRAQDQARARDRAHVQDQARARDEPRARSEPRSRANAGAGDSAGASDAESRMREKRSFAREASDKATEANQGRDPAPATASPDLARASPPSPGAPLAIDSGAAPDATAAAENGAIDELRGERAETGNATIGTLASARPGASSSASSGAGGARTGAPGSKPASASSAAPALQIADDADAALHSSAPKGAADGKPEDSATDAPQTSRQALSGFAARLAEATAGACASHGVPGLSGGAAPQFQPVAAPVHVGAIATPVSDAGFPGQLAGEAASLVMTGIESAEITLRPRELGPVKIEISLNGESASIAFSAAQPDTRQAIEQSLPILKDMLANHGLLLSDTSVSDGRTGAGDGRSGHGSGSAANSTPGRADGRGPGSGPGTHGGAFDGLRQPGASSRGLLDLYA